MIRKLYILFVLLTIVFFAACEKEEKAIVLPPAGEVEQSKVVMGTTYDNQVYFDFATGKTVTRQVNAYDLAFEASAAGKRIYLNGGKLMMAARCENYNMNMADTNHVSWNVDNDPLDNDSTAIGNWWEDTLSGVGMNSTIIIDRGLQMPSSKRFRKMQVISVSEQQYKIRFCNMDNSELTEMNIPKDPAYSLIYFSFDNGGKIVQCAPPANEWDIVFTRYTHVFFDEPYGSVYRNYTVSGVLINRWNNVTGVRLQKDSSAFYIPFSQFNATNISSVNFIPNADVIGYKWKFYDFNSSQYTMVPDLYYLIKSHNGFIYKIRMVDFYDVQGNKGTITFEYQRL